MDRNSTRINSSHPCWRHHGQLLRTVLPDIFQKCSLSGSRLTGQKNITGALIDEVNGEPEHLICCIKIHSLVANLTKTSIATADPPQCFCNSSILPPLPRASATRLLVLR